MIWWLVAGFVGALGIANAILDRLRKAAARERRRWEEEHKRVEEQIREYDRRIADQLQRARYVTDFHVLTRLHFESMKIADHAYSLLQDSRKALDAIGQSIVETGREKRRLIDRKKSTWSFRERAKLEQEIQLLIELQHQLYPDKDKLKSQRDRFLEEVRKFNAQTHALKLTIRDRCGIQGRDWHLRLEERTRRRRLGLPVAGYSQIMGTVKWFNKKEGYGFITPDDDHQQDVYVNIKQLKNTSSLRQGDRVKFERRYNKRGPWAKDVYKD